MENKTDLIVDSIDWKKQRILYLAENLFLNLQLIKVRSAFDFAEKYYEYEQKWSNDYDEKKKNK